MIRATLLHLSWEGVTGATEYEIQVDGVKVSTAGANARTTKVSVRDGKHTVAVVDLPSRSRTQKITVEYGVGSAPVAFGIPTYEIHVRPKYYNGADGAASGYRAVWLKHVSNTTSSTSNGGRELLTPQSPRTGIKSWEWWSAWELWIDPAWDPAKQGQWGTMHNWHTAASDVGGPCGPIGWAWPDDGVSSFFYSFMGGNLYRGGLNGVQTALLTQGLTKGVWHSLLTQYIGGRTDGSIPAAGHPNGGKGRVRLWLDGNDTPIDSGDTNTLRRATCPKDGIAYTQTALWMWDGFYTKNCTQDCASRFVAARFGRTLAECLADNTVRLDRTEISNILDPNGIGPDLGPSTYATLTPRTNLDFKVPTSFGGSPAVPSLTLEAAP